MDTVVDQVASRLEAAVTRFHVEQRLPGLAVGVVRAGVLAWTATLGFADHASGRKVDPDTLFRVASITKSVTATAIMQLRDERRLRLDDPLVEHVPEAREIADPFGPVEELTLRRLLAHTSGLENDVPPRDDPWKLSMWTQDQLLAQLGSARVLAPPETGWRYSNLAYELLGVVVTRVSGEPFDAYVRRAILDVAGMTSSVFYPEGDLARRAATGYGPRQHEDALVASRPESSAEFLADGGLWSTVGDLARWIVAQSRNSDGDRRGDGARVLDGRSLREMQRSAVLVDQDWSLAYGLGWMSRRIGDARWVGHTGSFFGWRAHVLFRPEDGLGVVALVNGSVRPDPLVLDVAALVLEAHRDAVPSVAGAPTATPEAWRELLGTYQEAEYGLTVRVECRDGALLVLEDPTAPPQRIVGSADPLAFTFDGGDSEGERCTFLRGSAGDVAGLNLVGLPLRKLVPAER